jgi:signal transduction histidine kinase
MSVVEPADTVPRRDLNTADMHAALLNILEDSTADRLRAQAAVTASLNLLEDLSEAQADVRTLNDERTAELVVANKNLEAFTYSVAHDLRSPLRALSGYSEALLEDFGDRLGETGRWYAERIRAGTERMGTLIDDLLNLSRVSSVELSLGPVDLSAEVAAIAGELQGREPGRHVRFVLQDGVWVTADRSLIRTVLQNLIDNAWKYSAKLDDAVIEFGATTEDTVLCCYVRDNGAGFDPAFEGMLFQPFQRLHAVTDFPGSGIGLASVRRIIERHGGRVWAEGAVDRGATFYFTLNAKEGRDDSAVLL